MYTLIKRALVYTPECIGEKDVLISFDRVAAVEDHIDSKLPGLYEVVDARGKILVPGFIDQHVHITGGGGEGGFSTRTREIESSDLLEGGITTVVGVLGTDGVTRSLEGLYAKAKALEQEGITTYIYTGSYQVPPITFTGSIQRDMVLIDKVLGVGEIAISDHRSFQPTRDELMRIAAEARVGGMLSGKAGVVHLHLGDGGQQLDMVMDIINHTPIPVTQFVPTHINRNGKLFSQAVEFAKRGGVIDLTAGFERGEGFTQCIPAYEAFETLVNAGVDVHKITISSDGNGSIPAFDKNGLLAGIQTASCKALHADLVKAVVDRGIPLESMLHTLTVNVAKLLKLDRFKGTICVGGHADLVLMGRDYGIEKVYAKGLKVVEDGRLIKS